MQLTKNPTHHIFLLGLGLATSNILVSLMLSELLIPWWQVENLKAFRIINYTSFAFSCVIAVAVIYLTLYIIYMLLYFKTEIEIEDYLQVSINFIKFCIGFEVFRLIFGLLLFLIVLDFIGLDKFLEILNYFNYTYFLIAPFVLTLLIIKKNENFNKAYLSIVIFGAFSLLFIKNFIF